MTPSPRRERVTELFEAALGRSANERNDFLLRACEGDGALLSEVTSLIAEFERLGESGQAMLPADQSDRRKNTVASPENLKQIGRFSVVRELGRGAMGVVFEAWDPLIARTVAIKTIRLDDFGAASEGRWLQERLFREARSAGALSHPGIVTIHDLGLHEDLAFIAMEYVDGPTLESIMTGQRFDYAKVIDILRQAATALDYANEAGVVHRDVKPGNIMLHHARTVKITDFGIAKITTTQQLTRTGTVMGTPSYMSPEQIRALPVDGRADQFSLGVVAFEMLTGLKPFRADSLATLVHQIVYEDRPSARTVNDDLCEAVDRVFFRALAKTPEQRFANCAQMVEELSEALKKAPIELEEKRQREEQERKLDSGLREIERPLTSFDRQAAESRLDVLAGECEGELQVPVLLTTPRMASSQALIGFPRMQAILWIAVAVALAHGVLWALAERLFGWNFGEGTSLPQGFSAVILSLTMTVPLIVVPPLYEHLFHTSIISPRHWLGGALIVVFSAFGHLILYGSETLQFVGLRNLIFPLGISEWYRALPMEVIYAVMHFSTVVLLYRVVVGSQSGPLTVHALLPALIACLTWLSADFILILLKYPGSLADSHLIVIRGFLNAITLMMTLTGGMLM
jgi:serine/threonine protein kinase